MKKFLITPLLLTIFVCVHAGVHAIEHTTIRMLIWEGYAPAHLRMKFIDRMKPAGVHVRFDVKYVNGPDEFTNALKKWRADIITPSHHQPKDLRYRLIKDRLALPLDLSLIPNYRDVLPALQNADYCTEAGRVYAVPMMSGPYGLIYNADLVKPAPRSLNVLFDPRYRGRYAIAGDFDDANVYVAALAAGIDRGEIFNFDKVYSPAVRQALKTLAHNAESFWLGIDVGKCHRGLALGLSWGFCLPSLRRMGENWKLAAPIEGTTGWVDGFMIASAVQRDPLKLKVAHAYLDFVLGKAYQLYVVRGLAAAPVTVSVKNHLAPDEIAEFHLDEPDFFAKNNILWKPLRKRERDGFRALWQEATSGILEKKIAIGKERLN